MRLAFRIAAFLIITALLALAGCGGQGFSGSANAPAIDSRWPGHGWEDGAREGAFVAVAVDSTERNLVDLTQRLRIETTRAGGDTIVTIFGRDIDSHSAYLHLKYDGAAVHPVETQRGSTLDENALFLGIATLPNVVDLGVTSIGGGNLPAGELELAQVRFAPGAFTGTRTVSVASSNAPNDLHFEGNQLVWSYNAAGDFDQNSETNIADLTPLGVHLNHSTSDGVHDAADEVVDGDGNGLVTIAELTVIGANILRRTTAYRVETAPTDSGPFTAVAGGNVAQNTGELPVGGGRLQYSFDFSPQSMAFYHVRVLDGTEEGPASNQVQFGVVGGGPPQNLSAMDDGTKITLTWSPPATGSPTGYDAYVSDDPQMAGASKMNPSTIAGTTFDCNPIAVQVGVPHYFAVKAKYASGDSGYSNVFAYGGAAGPPSGLTAVKEGASIRLNWTAPPGGADSYNCYIGDQPDLSDGIMMHLPGQVTTTTYLTPGAVDAEVEHYFGVKAVVDSTETGFSNIAHYTPTGGGDTTPPQWQGGIGIRAAEPDDQKVKIYWYPAIDPAPGTPPVQYLVYFSPEGTPIDWDNPTDVVDAPTVSYTIPGLTNGQRYEFAVRAQDGVPNATSNTNTLFAKPAPFPPAGNIGTIVSSDIASVRMPGEEVPRVFAVTHGNELWYATYDGDAWQTVDLNATLNINARKYHPQAVGVGDEIHVLFATGTGIFEYFGNKDADPATWTMLPVAAAGMSECYGTGYVYSSPASVDGEYFAAVYAGEFGAAEQLYYVERSAAGIWSTPELIMTGDPSIWQCDMCVSEVTGAQWVVACNGPQVTGVVDESPDFWYVTRPSKSNVWGSAVNTAKKSSTEITVRIDPLINQPVVINPETHWYEVAPAYWVPATSAAIYAWNGTVWSDEPSSPIEDGSGALEGQGFYYEEKGRDPQLVFSPSGKAVAIYTNVRVEVDLIETEYTLTGGWHLTSRPSLAWSKPSTMLREGIYSSNSVTAGESYQHCLTCFVADREDNLSEAEVSAKYAVRNHYPPGDLYYFRQAWP